MNTGRHIQTDPFVREKPWVVQDGLAIWSDRLVLSKLAVNRSDELRDTTGY